MKVIKLALVLMFVVGLTVGCGKSGGGGGATFDDCVKSGMDQITKQAQGNASAAEAARPTIEQSCQVCKDKAGSDECNMIIKGLSGQTP